MLQSQSQQQLLLMSFGQHEFQHRFYRNQPHKKLVGQSPVQSRVMPVSPYQNYDQFFTPQAPRHAAENPLNLRVRAGEMGYNQPGWEGYRLKSYVIDKYGQNYRNYQNDRETIEKFKREAQEHKRRLRFGDRYAYEQPPPQLLPEIRMKTEPQVDYRYYPQEELGAVNANPERQEVDRFDVGIMARVQSRQQEKHYTSTDDHERRERRRLRELKQYRKKYSKLKTKLKEELNLQRREESREHSQKEERNMSRIERLITDVSDRITKNAIIFNEGLRVEKEIREMREQSRSPEPIANESKLTIIQQVEPAHTHYSTIAETQSKPPTPRVVYNHSQLNQSYEQLQHLKKEISRINQRIQKGYKQL